MDPNLTAVLASKGGQDTETHRGKTLWGPRKRTGTLHTKEMSLRGKQPCQHLDFGLPDSRTMRKCLLSKLLRLAYFVMAALGNSYNVQSENGSSIFLLRWEVSKNKAFGVRDAGT